MIAPGFISDLAGTLIYEQALNLYPSQLPVDPFQIEEFRIKAIPQPRHGILMAIMVRIVQGYQQIAIAGRPAGRCPYNLTW